ncbi:MAG: carboxynorspermidine decarboxylase [Butyrivibrio sp.]|uniref:carboxynorspermidine decarboxylase n=1 Tax=Butyrivibrio sp. TaxID=28121 RepID=UPI001B5B8E08|nr:carboxynorspermidine decarboxylase [Butyrivibrio sp.]MBP3782602.1 carboxynorspermidine decarboxylase [Butyrivibrio sp.]
MKIDEISTPAYVINEKRLRENLEILKDVQERSGAKILLAQKAYSAYQTYPLLASYLSGATASGIFEARLAHEEFKTSDGKKCENHVYEPAYKDSDMEELCNICDHVVFNSISQLEHHRSVWEKYVSEGKIKVGLRINPELSAEDAHEIYDPCSPGSRLGIRNENMPDDLPEGVSGLHFHNLCEQGFEPLEETFLKVERDFFRFFPAPRIPDDYDGFILRTMGFEPSDTSYDEEVALDNIPVDTDELDAELGVSGLNKISWINLGGGHHITREDYDREGLIKLVLYIREKYGIEVYLEPGEAIALDAGYLVTTVMDVVDTDRIPVLILDASASCHMPDVIEMPYRPPLKDSEEPGEMNYTYRLSSMTCLAGDVIGDYSFETEKNLGDKLFFEDMAIYSFVKNNTFNGMPLPDIDIMHEDGEVEVLRRFSYEDFKNRL